MNLFVPLFCFTCFLFLIEQDGRSGSGASCSNGSLEDVGQGFGDRGNGETSVDFRFVSDCLESFWLGQGWDDWGSTGAVGTATSGALLLLMMGWGRAMGVPLCCC